MIIIQANGAERELEEKILALLRREDIAAERSPSVPGTRLPSRS